MNEYENNDIIKKWVPYPYVYECHAVRGQNDNIKYRHIELFPFEKKITDTSIEFMTDINF
jgi:hypothetical protein